MLRHIAYITIVLGLSLFSSQVIAVAHAQSSSQEQVTIGALIPQTGRSDNAGEHRTYATKLAVDDFNSYLAESGATWRMNLVIKDTGANPDITLAKVQEFDAEGVRYLSGPSASGNLKNIQNYLNANDMLTVSCCSTSAELAQPDNIFRLAPDDRYHGPVIASLMYEAGKRHMITVYADDSFGVGLQNFTTRAFEQLGGTTDSSTLGAYDKLRCSPDGCPEFATMVDNLSAKIQELTTSGTTPDEIVVAFIGFSEIAHFLRLASEDPYLGQISIQWVGSDANINDENLTSDPDLARYLTESNFRSCIFDTDTTSAAYQKLEPRLNKQFDNSPNVYAYSSYDTVWVLGLAIEKAGGPNATFEDVKAQIMPTANDYVGTLGNIKLNAAGDLQETSYSVWGIEGSEWRHLGTFVPGIGFVAQETQASSGDALDEHQRSPTFGISPHLHSLVVRCGYSFDGQCHDVDGYHVDYKRNSIKTGSSHDISLKAYGTDSLKWFQIGFGVPSIGSPISDAEASILVEVARDNMQHHAYGIRDISYDNESNVIGQDAKVSVSAVPCMDGHKSGSCVQVDIRGITFREQMYHEPFVIQVADSQMRTSSNYMNEGILVSGNSLNPTPHHTVTIKTASQNPAENITIYRTDKLNDLWTDGTGYTFTHNGAGIWQEIERPARDMSTACNDVDNRLCDAFDAKMQWHASKVQSLRDSLYGDIYSKAPFANLRDPVTIYDTDGDSRTNFLAENNMAWIRD